ncbi:hypothetical protein R3P38DRAFT_2584596 [Favolaschia claudopus]|uniref:Reverse transcriptase n=1 Tax=Favolaschia claudopus TaxID=2862362 RepID=A0AAV9Z8K5_9AGAR
MVFGPLPQYLPTFFLNGHQVGYTDCFCYVGITFQSTARNIFRSHYIAKAAKARKAGFAVFGVEAYVGVLPPKEGRMLYMSCVDPHLVSGADVVIDVDKSALDHLEKVQHAFLRRLLGLGPYSLRAPLFTELGLVPIRYRRLILALRYLGYLVGLTAGHYARAALEDSYQLFLNAGQGYWTDLVYALQQLEFPVVLPPLQSLTPAICSELGKAVYTSAMRSLDGQIDNSTRLYLLHARREPFEDEPPKKVTAVLRHYLELVVNASHRKAITRLLLSQHPLAVERMRYKQRYHRVLVPRDERLCRFGCRSVETVEHALFFCRGKVELIEWREWLADAVPDQGNAIRNVGPWNATSVLRSLIFSRVSVCQVAKVAHKVLGIFAEEPMVWPDGA